MKYRIPDFHEANKFLKIFQIFGDRRLLIFVQLTCLYCKLCWTVAIYTYTLLIHSTNYEFAHFNEQIRSVVRNVYAFAEVIILKIDDKHYTDESLSIYILKMMKVFHTQLDFSGAIFLCKF